MRHRRRKNQDWDVWRTRLTLSTGEKVRITRDFKYIGLGEYSGHSLSFFMYGPLKKNPLNAFGALSVWHSLQLCCVGIVYKSRGSLWTGLNLPSFPSLSSIAVRITTSTLSRAHLSFCSGLLNALPALFYHFPTEVYHDAVFYDYLNDYVRGSKVLVPQMTIKDGVIMFRQVSFNNEIR
jgi:hypothetical protein